MSEIYELRPGMSTPPRLPRDALHHVADVHGEHGHRRHDPGEKTDLAAQHPQSVEQLLARLETLEGEAAPPKGLNPRRPKGFQVPRVWGERSGP